MSFLISPQRALASVLRWCSSFVCWINNAFSPCMHASYWLHNRIHFSIYEAKEWRNGRKKKTTETDMRFLLWAIVMLLPAYPNAIYSSLAIVQPTIRNIFLHLFWKCDKNACNSSLNVNVFVLSKPTVSTWFRSIFAPRWNSYNKIACFLLPCYKTTPVWLSRVSLFTHVYIAFFSKSLFHLQQDTRTFYNI